MAMAPSVISAQRLLTFAGGARLVDDVASWAGPVAAVQSDQAATSKYQGVSHVRRGSV